ncbi:MAG: hypothetical protein M1838_005895 [Thelocarpon superellum]|nr:MAG: hypothetical protein M1838_005895 [Thelocarpon superellum]
MSDDEDYFEMDDLFGWEDEPADDVAAWADDLAEHAVHSPVWLNDPTFEMAEYWSDWDYYSDDYYDIESTPRRRKATAGINDPTLTSPRKRKRADEDEQRKRARGDTAMPNSATAGPALSVVKWRPRNVGHTLPLLDPTLAEKVSVMADWRTFCKTRESAGIRTPSKSPGANVGPAPCQLGGERGASTGTLPARSKRAPLSPKSASRQISVASLLTDAPAPSRKRKAANTIDQVPGPEKNHDDAYMSHKKPRDGTDAARR